MNTLDENSRQIVAQIELFHKEDLRNDLCHNLSLKSSKNNQDITDLAELNELPMLTMEN